MSFHPRSELPLLGEPAASCCGPGGCAGSPIPTTAGTTASAAPTTLEPKETEMSEQTNHTYQVSGMTCGHCAGSVTEELKALDGVSDVSVDLVAGGTSTVRVTSNRPLDETEVTAALDEAGDYRLV